MKAFAKFCLILSGVLAVIGCGLLLAAVAMGVSFPMLLDLAHYPGEFASGKLELIDNIEDTLEDIDDSLEHFDPGLLGRSSWGEEYYEFVGVTDLDFDLSLCKLEILRHKENFIALEAENTKNYFRCRTDDDTLILTDSRKVSTTQNSMDNALKLKLYLPEETLESVNIVLSAGTVDIEELNFKDMVLDNDVGELNIKALDGDSLALSVGVGDCNVERISVAGSCSVETGTGSVSIRQYEGADLDLDCGIGDVDITAVGKETDYNYTLNCNAGEILIGDQKPESEGHYEEHSGIGFQKKADHEAGRSLDIQCGLGSLKLSFTEED